MIVGILTLSILTWAIVANYREGSKRRPPAIKPPPPPAPPAKSAEGPTCPLCLRTVRPSTIGDGEAPAYLVGFIGTYHLDCAVAVLDARETARVLGWRK